MFDLIFESALQLHTSRLVEPLISGIGLKCRTHKLLSRDVMADILHTFIRH